TDLHGSEHWFSDQCESVLSVFISGKVFSLSRKGKSRIRIQLRPNLHLHRLLAEFFVQRNQGVITWRQVLDGKAAISAGYGKVRMGEHVDVGPDPRMLVALHRDHHLRLGEGFEDWLIGW